jgi:hypothetical protein
VRVLLGGIVLGLLVAGCSDEPDASWQLPDRDDPSVLAEEARLAAVVEASDVVWHTFGPMACDVRLLGAEAAASFVWAECGVDLDDGGRSGLSVPLRIEGDTVIEALDGDLYADSVEEMFPPALADLVLDDQEPLRP